MHELDLYFTAGSFRTQQGPVQQLIDAVNNLYLEFKDEAKSEAFKAVMLPPPYELQREKPFIPLPPEDKEDKDESLISVMLASRMYQLEVRSQDPGRRGEGVV